MSHDQLFLAESAVAVMNAGRRTFTDLVRTGDSREFTEKLYTLSIEDLRAVVLERVLAERGRSFCGLIADAPAPHAEHETRALRRVSESGRRDSNSGPPVPQTHPGVG